MGVSTEEAVKAFQILGQNFESYNKELLKQLKTSTPVIYPETNTSNIEFISSADTITELEARITKLEKLVDELRTNAIEKTENPKQKGDLEIFDQKDEIEDDNIFNINTDMFQIDTEVNWNNIQGWSLDTKKDMEEYNFGTIYK